MKNAVYNYVVWMISLSVCLVACTPAATPAVTPTATPTFAPTIPPTSEVGLDSEFPVTCSASDGGPDAQLKANLTPPESIEVPPGALFRQTWRLQNTGACAWPEDTRLVVVSGNMEFGPKEVPVLSAAPSTEVDITVELTTPSQPGQYQSYWRLQTSQGQLFGDLITMTLTVLGENDPGQVVTTPVQPPTPTPFATRTPRATLASPPLATRVPTPGTSGSCQGPDPRFTTLINQATEAGIPVTCATAPVEETSGKVQVFWQEIDTPGGVFTYRSFIIVQELQGDEGSAAYVLRGRDGQTFEAQVRIYTVAWTPSMPEQPEACTPLVPPEGYILPTQGIGTVWCEKSLWNSIGWPNNEAQAAGLAIQRTSTGLLMEVSSASGETYNIAIHLEAKAATVCQNP